MNRSSRELRLSRRKMVAATVGTAAASLAGLALMAQAPSPPSPDFDKAARESHRENSATLAALAIPISLEPAFQFKA
jgi:hypothetical protein